MFGTCCSFRGNSAALYLVALGLGQLALDLYAPKGPIEAGEFAKALRTSVKQYRERLGEAAREANVPSDEAIEKAEIRVPDVSWRFRLGDALQTLDVCAAWHEKVALAGFGVHPWF